MLTPWLRPVLQALDNKRVLIVAHENITNNYYPGNNRSCLVSNCLFRVGGAACLMSNRCASTCRSSCRQKHTPQSVASLVWPAVAQTARLSCSGGGCQPGSHSASVQSWREEGSLRVLTLFSYQQQPL